MPARLPIVCQVLHSLQIGGAEMLAARLARRLRHEFEFVFACLDDLGTLGEELQNEGYEVEVLGRRAGLDLSCVRRLAAFASRRGVSLIHAHQYTPFVYSRAPGWLGYRPPVLFTEHGRFHPDLPNRKRMMFNRVFLRGRDRVLAVGESVKRALIENEGIPAQRIEVIYNGVQLNDFSVNSVLRAQVRAELNLPEQAPVAILVARLDYLKDHATALRTAAQMKSKRGDFRLLLVGDGPERPKIERQIAELNLSGNVSLLGMRSDIQRLLAAADVFLLTSISEGIPVTLIEAMGAGLPIVSTDVGGIREVVVHHETGLLAAAGDDIGLANALNSILQDRELAKRLGEQGRARAERIFTEAVMHERYAAYYREMMAHATPTASGKSANSPGGVSDATAVTI